MSRRSSEAGESLVEALVTITIMGTVVVGLLAALGTAITVSDHGHRTARAAIEATSRAEAYLALPYVDCASVGAYNGGGFGAAHPLPTGYTATLGVEYLAAANPSPSPGAAVATSSFSGSCPSPDQGVQRLTITVSSGSGGHQISQAVVVLKRNDTCSAAAIALPSHLSGQSC